MLWVPIKIACEVILIGTHMILLINNETYPVSAN